MSEYIMHTHKSEVKTMRILRILRAGRLALVMPALAFLIMLSGRTPALAESAGKLRKINVAKEGDHLYVKLTGTARFRYRVKSEENPPRLTIQLYDTTAELGYNSLDVNEGYVKNVKIQESTISGQRATFVIIHLNQNVTVDYGLSGDGRTLYISTPTYAGAGKGDVSQYSAEPYSSPSGKSKPAAPASPAAPAGDIGLPPEITVPGNAPSIKPAASEMVPYSAAASTSDGASIDFSQNRGPDNSPYIVGPIILQDADISKAMQLLSEAAGGASIIVEASIVKANAPSAKGGGGGGITMTLSHITLEDALDVITSANSDWVWKKVAGSYLVVTKETANQGLDALKAASVYDATNQAIQVSLYKPKYLDACTLVTYVALDVPSSGCDPALNWLLLKGRFEDIERAKAILGKVDTSKGLKEPSAEKKLTDRLIDKTASDLTTHIVRLKYIRAKALSKQIESLMENPFFGNLQIITSRMGGDTFAGNEKSMNTVSIDEGSNTMVFVGREEIFRRLQQVVQQLDVPFSATSMKTIQLKNAFVEDLKKDLEGVLKNLGRTSDDGNSIMYNNINNTITFIGTEDNYTRLVQIVQSYDTDDKAVVVDTVPFTRTKAIEVLTSGMVGVISNAPQYGYPEFWDGKAGFKSQDSEKGGSGHTRITLHQPTNSFIITAQKQYMDRLKEFIKSLDIETADLSTKIIRLKHISGFRAVNIIDTIMNTERIGESKITHMDGGFWADCNADAPDNGRYELECRSDIAIERGRSTFKTTALEGNDSAAARYNMVSLYYESNQNALVVKANEYDFKRITEIISMIDVPYQQIRVDIQVVSVSEDDLKNISRALSYQDGKSKIGNTMEIKTLSFIYDTAQSYTADFIGALDQLVTNNRASIIANPTIITRENVFTRFQFQDFFTYRTYTQRVDPQTGQLITETTIHDIPYGPAMALMAHVNTTDSTVLLHIWPIYDTFQGLNEAGDPIHGTANMDHEVVVKSGETIISSGFITNTESEGVQMVPLLGNLPIIGKMFRSKTNTKISKQVLFLITPTIMPAL